MRVAGLPMPLPFGALKARRSLVSIGNLISAVQYVLQTQTAENSTFIVADREALTMAEIIRALRRGLGRSELLLPVPDASLAKVLRLVGKGDFADRLMGDLVADAGRLRRIGWVPPEGADAALAACSAAVRAAKDTDKNQAPERYRDARH
jgi:UDP-glucose 4-epimerase